MEMYTKHCKGGVVRYLFNGFEIDTLQFKLLSADKTLAIEPKVFDLLVYLLENRHRTVTREELFDSVWQGQVVCDTSLSNHINSARKILGDNGHEQKVIATLRGRGYQFVAETQEVDSAEGITSSQSSKTIAINKRFIYGISSILFLMLLVLLGNHAIEPASDAQGPLRIAVLPFNNVKSDPQSNYLGFAIADQIIGNIAYLEQVTVRASSSVRKYEMQNIDPIKIGKELNVEYVLTGNYVQLANSIRINVELIEVAGNNLMWRETIQSESSDAFSLHTQIVKTVVEQLNLQISFTDTLHMNKDTPASAKAYDFYLQAIAYPITVEGGKLAIAMLEKSLELDSNFAPSYVELAYRTNYLAVFNVQKNVSKHTTIELYKKALSLNPESKTALSGLANFYTETGETGKAVELSRKLIALNPRDAQAHFSLGYSYRYAGMIQESITEMELALAIDPNNPRFRSIMMSYGAAGQYEQALTVFNHFAQSPDTLSFKNQLLMQMGRMDEALALAEHRMTLNPIGVWYGEATILKAIINGDNEAGLQKVRELEVTTMNDAEASYIYARYYAALGDKQGCYKLLGWAIDNGYFNYPLLQSIPFFFDSVRDEPEFQELLALAKKKHLDFKQQYF